MALSQQFVRHLLCSQMGIALREYMKDVRIPEENIYAMLFMTPGVPGGFNPRNANGIFSVNSCIWLDGDHSGLINRFYVRLFPKTVCHGKNIHNVCILSAKDLQRVSYRPGVAGQRSNSYLMSSFRKKLAVSGHYEDKGPLFHTRHELGYDPIPMLCMEDELARRNELELSFSYHSNTLQTISV